MEYFEQHFSRPEQKYAEDLFAARYNEFDSDDLVWHIKQTHRNYIIQGQGNCRRRDHRKPNSLDCWLRDDYGCQPDTRQAVNEVIHDLLATGDFEEGNFDCPESGNLCKGIKILV